MCYRAPGAAASPQAPQGLSMLNLLMKSASRKQEARRLYDVVVSRAREPVFFARFGVADSVDGRFDMLAFHAWLVLRELKGADPAQGGPAGPGRRTRAPFAALQRRRPHHDRPTPA